MGVGACTCARASPRLCPSQRRGGTLGGRRASLRSGPRQSQAGHGAVLSGTGLVLTLAGRGEPGHRSRSSGRCDNLCEGGSGPCGYSPVSNRVARFCPRRGERGRRRVSAARREGGPGKARALGDFLHSPPGEPLRLLRGSALVLGGPPGSGESRRGLMSSGCRYGTGGEVCGAAGPLGSARRLRRCSAPGLPSGRRQQCEGPCPKEYLCVCVCKRTYVRTCACAYIRTRVMYMQNVYNVYILYKRVLYIRMRVYMWYTHMYVCMCVQVHFAPFTQRQNNRGKCLGDLMAVQWGCRRRARAGRGPTHARAPAPPAGGAGWGYEAPPPPPPRRRGVTAGAPSAYVRDGRLRVKGAAGLRRRSAAA